MANRPCQRIPRGLASTGSPNGVCFKVQNQGRNASCQLNKGATLPPDAADLQDVFDDMRTYYERSIVDLQDCVTEKDVELSKTMSQRDELSKSKQIMVEEVKLITDKLKQAELDLKASEVNCVDKMTTITMVNKNLEQNVLQLRKQLEDKDDECNNHKKENKELQRAQIQLECQLEQRDHKIKELIATLEECKKCYTMSEKACKDLDDNLKHACHTLLEKDAQLEQNKNCIIDLQRQNSCITEDLRKKDERINQLQNEVAKAKEEWEANHTKFQQYEKEIAELRGLVQQIPQLEGHIQCLKKNVQEKECQLMEQEKTINCLKQDLATRQCQINDHHTVIDALSKEVTELKHHLKTKTEHLERLKSLEQQVPEKDNKIECLEHKLKQLECTLAKYDESLKCTDNARQTLAKEKDELKMALECERKHEDDIVHCDQQKMEELGKQIRAFEKKSDELAATLKGKEEVIAKQNGEIDYLRHENHELCRQLECKDGSSTEKDRYIQELQAEMRCIRDKLNTAICECAQLQKTMDTLKCQNERKCSECAELICKLDAEERRFKDMEKQLHQHIEQQHTTIQNMHSTIALKNQEICCKDQLVRELERKFNECSSRETRVVKTTNPSENCGSDSIKSQCEINALKEQIKCYEKFCKEQNDIIDELRARISDMEKNLCSAKGADESQLTQAREMLAQAASSNYISSASVKKLQKELENISKTMKSSEQEAYCKITQLLISNAILEGQVQQLTESVDKSQCQLQQLEEQMTKSGSVCVKSIEEQNCRIRQLEGELNCKNQAYQKLEQECDANDKRMKDQLCQERTRLEQALQDKCSAAREVDAEWRRKYDATVNDFRAELNQLKEDIKSKAAAYQQLESAFERHDNHLQDLQRLLQDERRARDTLARDSSERIRQLECQCHSKSDRMNELQQELVSMKDQCDRRDQHIECYASNLQQIECMMQKFIDKTDQLVRSNQGSSGHDPSGCHERLQTCDRSIELSRSTSNPNQCKDRLDEDKKNLKRIRCKTAEVEKRFDWLIKETAQRNEEKKFLEKLKEDISTMQCLLEESRFNHEQCRMKIQEMECRENKLQQLYKDSEEKARELSRTLVLKERQLAEGETITCQLKRMVAGLQDELQGVCELRRSNDQLKEVIESLKVQLQMKEMAISDKENEIHKVCQHAHALQQELGNYSGVQRDKELCECTVRSLNDQLCLKDKQLGDERGAHYRTKERINEFENKVNTLLQELRGKEDYIGMMCSQFHMQEQHIKDATDRVKELERALCEYRSVAGCTAKTDPTCGNNFKKFL